MGDKVTLEIVEGPDYSRDDEGWEHYAYKVRLRYQGRQMTTPWRQGVGITDDPDAASVLECLLMDAAGFDNARSFEEWAPEYGYDVDSRAAEKIYRAVQVEAGKLARLLGDDYQAAVFPTADDDYDQERIVRRLAAVQS